MEPLQLENRILIGNFRKDFSPINCSEKRRKMNNINQATHARRPHNTGSRKTKSNILYYSPGRHYQSTIATYTKDI